VTCPVLLLGGVGGSHRYWAGTTPSAAGDHVVTGDRLWLRAAAEATAGYTARANVDLLVAPQDCLGVDEPGLVVGSRLRPPRPRKAAGEGAAQRTVKGLTLVGLDRGRLRRSRWRDGRVPEPSAGSSPCGSGGGCNGGDLTER
jgi:hypothetical protein